VEQLRIGFVGAGGMGNHHARELLRREEARPVSVCDPSDGARERLLSTLGAAAEGVHAFADLQEMLEAASLDAAVITTPHTQHGEHVRACLEAGLNVLVEKPMTTTARDARELIALAEKNDRVLAIAYQRHGDGKFVKARELVQSGTIGEVRLVHVIIAQDCLDIFRPGASWRADPALSGGGHFMDTGSHINDMLLWITGLEPKQVMAFINPEGTLVDVQTAVAVECTNGAVGNLSYTSMSPEWREEFTFYGTEGVMRLGAGEPLRVTRRGEDTVLPRPSAGGKSPLQNFLDAIQGMAEGQAPPVCGLRVAQLTEAAYKSAQSGRPEPVG
jgi:predicted dehydrogenase